MSIGVSVFLLAVGAILTFAVEASTDGLNLDTVGIILMVAGALGLLCSLLFWSSYAPFGTAARTQRTVVREDHVV